MEWAQERPFLVFPPSFCSQVFLCAAPYHLNAWNRLFTVHSRETRRVSRETRRISRDGGNLPLSGNNNNNNNNKNNNNNTLYLKRVARNSYKTNKLVALYLKITTKI